MKELEIVLLINLTLTRRLNVSFIDSLLANIEYRIDSTTHQHN